MSRAVSRTVFWGLLLAITGIVVSGAHWMGRRWSSAGVRTQHAPAWDLTASGDASAPAERIALPEAAGHEAAPPQRTALGWPAFLGPRHDGTSPETGLNLSWSGAGPLEKWRVNVGTGYAGPVAIDGLVVLLHRKQDREIVECFDTETGSTRWDFSWPTSYVGNHSYGTGPYSTPVIDNGRVYAIGATGRLCCLRLDDGAEVWHRNLHDDYRVKIDVWPVAASPLMDGERLILNLGGKEAGAGVIALDKGSGRTLWTATRDGASCSTPRAATVHGRRHVFVWTAEALVSIDPADGAVRWRIPFSANNHEAAHGTTPLVAGDMVFVSGYQIGNLCIRILPSGSYEELWRDKRQLLDSQYNNLVCVGRRVCGYSTTRRKLRCLDLASGELQWEWRSRIRNGTIIAVEGRHLLWGENGLLASLQMTDQGVAPLAITEHPVLAAPCFAYPALSGGILFLRNERELLAIDLRRSSGSG